VFLGRFVAFFRAVMPAPAGTAEMRYPRFLVYNAAGGIVWGGGVVLLGYLAGDSYAAVERTVGRGAALAAAAIVVVALIVWRVHSHQAECRATPPGRPMNRPMESAESPAGQLRAIRPLFAAGFVTAFGAHSIAANLGLSAPDLPARLFALGVLLALYDGAEVLLKPVFGSLADRIGPRPVLRRGI